MLDALAANVALPDKVIATSLGDGFAPSLLRTPPPELPRREDYRRRQRARNRCFRAVTAHAGENLRRARNIHIAGKFVLARC